MSNKMNDRLKKMMRMAQGSNGEHIWVTNFDGDSVIGFYEQFMEQEQNPLMDIIPVYVNSFGGQVHSLIAKRDLIKTSAKPVSTIAVGKAMSCGASLLASGSKGYRFASTDTRILIHQVSSMTLGKASDIKTDAEQVQDLNDMMLRNLAEDTGNSVAKLKQEIRNRENTDWTMTPQEALKWGMIDGVGIPRYIWGSTQGALQLFVDEKTGKAMMKDPRLKTSQPKPKKPKK